jgi:HSF-type DNA-binding
MDRSLFLLSPSRESSSRHHQQSQQPPSAEELILKNIILASKNPVTTSMIPLPSRLFSILANKELEHIISWLPQGRAWRIHNVEIFAQRLLPLFVNNNNMMGTTPSSSSVNKNLRAFTSQLEAWGFRELSRGPNSLAYYSEVSLWSVPLYFHSVVDL